MFMSEDRGLICSKMGKKTQNQIVTLWIYRFVDRLNNGSEIWIMTIKMLILDQNETP